MFRLLDIYGLPYNFTLFNQPVFKTNVGGIMSIFSIICFILSFVYFGQNFYNYKNPHYINQKMTQRTYPKYPITNNDLVIAVRLENTDGTPIDFSNLITIQFLFLNFTITPDGKYYSENKTLGFRDCKTINYTGMRLDYGKNLSGDNFVCLDLDNLVLGGFFDIDWQYFLQINVLPCFNSTANNKTNCLAHDKVIDYLLKNDIYMNIYTVKYFSDLSDYDNPLKLQLTNVFSLIDPLIGKSFQLLYKNANISYDMGILMDKTQNYSVFGLDYFFSDSYTIYPPMTHPSEKSILIFFQLFITNNVETFIVNYIKIQEIFANIGGIFNSIFLFFTVITSIFNIHERDMKIVNHLFDFSDFVDNNYLNKIIKEEDKSKIELNQIIQRHEAVVILNDLSEKSSVSIKNGIR